MRSDLTDDEADLVMANIPPEHRRWCMASCGPMPGAPAAKYGCACIGCIGGALSWDEFAAWWARESQREPTLWINELPVHAPTLSERLDAYKAKKR